MSDGDGLDEELGALLDGVHGARDFVPDRLGGREDLVVVAALFDKQEKPLGK